MISHYSLDVIIPTYNDSSLIDKCLKNLNQDSVQNIFIIDDASTDNTWEILKNYESEKVNISKNHKNLGNLKSINKLLSQTHSDFIAFQDADDWSDRQRFELQMNFIENHNLDFCFTNYIKVSSNGKEELYCGHCPLEFISIDNVKEIEPSICFASVIFNKSVYRKIGGFDPYFDRIGGADIDWLYRTVISGFKGGIINKPLYYYRDNQFSFTNSISLDKRKYISIEIARFFFNFRIDNIGTAFPKKGNLDNFIQKKLEKLNYNSYDNRRKFIAQQAIRGNFLSVFNQFFLIFINRPFDRRNLGLIKFIFHKLIKFKRE